MDGKFTVKCSFPETAGANDEDAVAHALPEYEHFTVCIVSIFRSEDDNNLA